MDKQAKKSGMNKKLFYVIPVAIILLWIISIVVLYLISNNPAERGQFGDMFGGVNALFSGLALAGVVVAIILQKNELELQRKELEDTREVLNMTKEAHVEQMKTLKLQQFENTFFKMLENLSNISSSFYYKTEIGPIAFHSFASKIIVEKNRNDTTIYQKEVDMYFSRFLNLLIDICKYIDKHFEDKETKEFYFNLTSSNMTLHEKQLISYLFQNYLDDDLKSFISEYKVIRNGETYESFISNSGQCELF